MEPHILTGLLGMNSSRNYILVIILKREWGYVKIRIIEFVIIYDLWSMIGITVRIFGSSLLTLESGTYLTIGDTAVSVLIDLINEAVDFFLADIETSGLEESSEFILSD
jgi:hypothetical protein